MHLANLNRNRHDRVYFFGIFHVKVAHFNTKIKVEKLHFLVVYS